MEKNKTEVKQKRKNKILSSLLFIIVCGAIGAVIGFLSAAYLEEFNSNNFLGFSGLILIFFLGYLVHIILHEVGHLIFGLMTGYSFVSFRIGSLTIIKEDGKLKFKKFNIPGTAGQCLMMPPDLKNGKYPFVIYNFGGVIVNLIVSIIGILVGLKATSPLNAILLLSGLGGIFAALTNGIPMKIGGIANDAYNVLSIFRDDEARRGFYLQLKIHGLQSQGIRIKDMPLESFKLKEDSDLSNPLNTAIRLMEYNWYLDNMDLEGAKKSIDSLMPYFNKIIPLFRNEINCERIFLELVGDCNKDFIDTLYDKDLKKYIKIAKFMIGKKRILMAYEAFYNEDKDKALKYYEELKELAKKYPIKGEADMELMISDWIRERL